MGSEMAVREQPTMDVLEHVVAQGDLANLTAEQRVAYYQATCQSLGLNPLTRPFTYIKLNGRLVLYANRGATDQLRMLHGVNLHIIEREMLNDIFLVKAQATLPDGRTDESIGAVSIKGLGGDSLANAYMKAETKAKRRVTLSIVGLGWLDESEIGSIPTAQQVAVDQQTGEIREQGKASETEIKQANPQPHWMEDDTARTRFWARCDKLDLGKPAVHREFGVASMKDCTLSEATVIALLDFLDHAIVDAGLKLAEVHEALNIGKIADLATGEMGRKAAEQKVAEWIAAQIEEEVTEGSEQPESGEEVPDDEDAEEIPF